jgi:phosphatidate cytidylyltransferase
MKRVATAVVLVPLVLALVFDAPYWLMSLVLALVAFLAAREYLAIVRAYGIQPFPWITLTTVVLSLLLPLTYLPSRLLGEDPRGLGILFAAAVVMLGPFILLAIGMRRSELATSLGGAAASFFGFAYVAIPLLSLWVIWINNFGRVSVFYTLVVVWTGDIFGYYGGRAFGRYRLAPRVSPNKTWEGTVASFIGSLAVGSLILIKLAPLDRWLFSLHLLPKAGYLPFSDGRSGFPLWFAILATALLNGAAQLGDLVESALKRGAGLKDSGSVLPGHGGILDRIDALLFAAPVALILFIEGVTLFPGFRFIE